MAVLPIKDDNFEAEVLKSELPVFIDLWAPWCGPCRSLTPIVEALSEDYAGKVKFVKVNVDENPAISEAFQISSIPLVAILKGPMVVDSLLGLRPKGALATWIDAALHHLAQGGGSEQPEPANEG
jgi:thioredoxin 1